MKKVIFYLSIVFGFCHTQDASALEVIPTHAFEIAKQESMQFAQNSQNESLYLVDHPIDIEEDEITDPAGNKFSWEKTAIKSNSFATADFNANFFRNILACRHFYRHQPSYFIFLGVLKL